MERVDQVEIPDVRRGRFIGDVNRMLERQVPDGEGLELGVPGLEPLFMIVVELGEARGQLAASGAGTRDDDQSPAGLYVLVGTIALIADDEVNVRGIAPGEAMGVDAYPPALQLVLEYPSRALLFKAGDHDARHLHVPFGQVVDELESVDIVGDAEIPPELPLLDISGVDTEQDVRPVPELLEKPHFDVGIIPGEDAGGVVIVGELAAEMGV